MATLLKGRKGDYATYEKVFDSMEEAIHTSESLEDSGWETDIIDLGTMTVDEYCDKVVDRLEDELNEIYGLTSHKH